MIVFFWQLSIISRPEGQQKLRRLSCPLMPKESSPETRHMGRKLSYRVSNIRAQHLQLGLSCWVPGRLAESTSLAKWPAKPACGNWKGTKEARKYISMYIHIQLYTYTPIVTPVLLLSFTFHSCVVLVNPKCCLDSQFLAR